MTHPLLHPATQAALEASGFRRVVNNPSVDALVGVGLGPMLRRGDVLLTPRLIKEGVLVMHGHRVEARLHGTLELLVWLAENPPENRP
jgi:hypothetical protein